MKNNRIIIAGSRTCPEYCNSLYGKVLRLVANLDKDDMEIVSGAARGADTFGEWFAYNYYNIPVKRFPADWNSLGKRAGFVRNVQMAEYATHLILIWDGKSKGSEHMLNEAKRRGLKTRVIKI